MIWRWGDQEAAGCVMSGCSHSPPTDAVDLFWELCCDFCVATDASELCMLPVGNAWQEANCPNVLPSP